jgi:hypothetical protein
MRRKLLVYIMIGLLSFVLIAASTTYAWFVRSNNYKSDLIGSSKVSYFADGTGTSLDPFIISNANHMFNLSKLQEMGYLQDKTYHFLVADEDTLAPITIDFTGAGVALPYQLFNPIGSKVTNQHLKTLKLMVRQNKILVSLDLLVMMRLLEISLLKIQLFIAIPQVQHLLMIFMNIMMDILIVQLDIL